MCSHCTGIPTRSLAEESLSDLMLGWEQGELSQGKEMELFQRLVDSGLAWSLQGMYGRRAKEMLEAGLIDRRHITEDRDED